MFKYFFGDDDTASLKNEPTIDYNNTIHSFNTVRPSSKVFNSGRNGERVSYQPPVSTIPRTDYNIIDYSDDDLDSIDHEIDLELQRDYHLIRENYTRTNNKLKFDWENHYNNLYNSSDKLDSKIKNNIINNNTNYSLPDNYPGKFVQRHRNDRNENEKDYQSDHSFTRPSALYQDVTNNIYVKSDTQMDIDKQIQKLQHEVDQEFIQKSSKVSNSSSQDIQLNSIIIKIKSQNEFLEELNDIIQLNEDKPGIPNNLLDEFNNLRLDYIKELKNSQIFYQSYYKLLNKYRQLKKDTSLKNKIHTNITKSKSAFTIREKVNLIRSLTKESKIKLTCANILSELDKLDDKDRIIEELNRKLEEANLKIQRLEKLAAEDNNQK
ncbi:hypothetical protein DFJ63DRAFT_313974 [Scheffersomyces coipomensis]|uniref:uncharacterized protein n=1 Tax=Scheffersomyces coipomensis TaxID=1788519 RepID=UPI00315D64BD